MGFVQMTTPAQLRKQAEKDYKTLLEQAAEMEHAAEWEQKRQKRRAFWLGAFLPMLCLALAGVCYLTIWG